MTMVASSEGARTRLKVGSVLQRAGQTAVGVGAAGLALGVLAWVVLAIAGAAAQARFVAQDAMPALLILAAAGQIVATIGRDRVDQAELLLGGLTIRIDDHGVGWSAPIPGSLTWEQVRFVVLARGRLWVGGPRAESVPDEQRPEWITYLRRVLRLDRFALDAPLAAFDRSRAEIARAIREASAGRFPHPDPGETHGRV